ncbi:MAG: hypothetical protein ACPG4N_03205 [Gammaproteobacteria bacterium]
MPRIRPTLTQTIRGIQMNNISTNITRLALIGIGAVMLTACNTTRDNTAMQLQRDSQQAGHSEYVQKKIDRATEEQLVSQLRENVNNVQATFELAKLRDANGRDRLARMGYSQVVRADAPETDQFEAMKSFAANRLQAIDAKLAAVSQPASNAYRF